MDEKMNKRAKMEVLKELMDMAMGEMKGRTGKMLGEMKKVSVMAPNKEALEEGLDKAKDVVEDMPMEDEEDDMDMEESEDEMSEENSEDEMSDDEKKLMLKKMMMGAKK
jgi:hypothetical protein